MQILIFALNSSMVVYSASWKRSYVAGSLRQICVWIVSYHTRYSQPTGPTKFRTLSNTSDYA